MRKLRLSSALMAAFILFQLALPLAHAAGAVQVSVKDTLAGYPTTLQTSILNLNSINAGVFFVTQPNGTVVRVNAVKNQVYNILTGELYGQQTRQAGIYAASVLLPGGVTSSPVTFRVYPDQVSLTQSKITALNPFLEIGQKGNIQVDLLDTYGNPVPNNAVQLISSRPTDEIKPVNKGQVGKSGEPANSDEKGRAYFEFNSSYSGISTLTALHLNKPLNQRVDVVVSQANPAPKEMGGNFLSSGLFGANLLESNNSPQVVAGPIHHFALSDLPANVSAGTEQTLTVTAQDANNNQVTNYTGKVLIGVVGDDNATFPKEYQFTEVDQGKHSFPLGFRFNTPGNITLQVFDANNFQIGGEKMITVAPANAVTPVGQNPATISGSKPTIKSPSNGSTVGSKSITVTGMSEAFKNINLFVDGIKNQSLSTDAQGFFTASVNNLSDGPHEVYAMVEEIGGGGQVSSTVTVTVDTTPPVLQSIFLSPDLTTYEPGQAITAMVVSEPNLDSASLTIQGIPYTLTPATDPGSYSATFAAPQAGQYFAKVTLTDALFNKSEYDAATFVVQGQKSAPLTKVEGIQGQGGEASFTLVWNALKTPTSPIQSYRIQYGTQFDNLSQFLEVPGTQTTATVSNLQNGVAYYANVVAKDSKGTESEPSITLAITPKSASTLPQIMDPSVVNVLGGTTTQASLTASPAENGVILQWVKGANQQTLTPAGYMTYFGLQAGQYTDSYYVQGNVNSVLIPDLIPGIKYYFKLVPVNAMGQELGNFYPEVTGVPGVAGLLGANIFPAASNGPSSPSFLNNPALAGVDKNTNSGPEAIWIVVLSLLASPVFYLYRRKVGT